jgi:hypothetical protein
MAGHTQDLSIASEATVVNRDRPISGLPFNGFKNGTIQVPPIIPPEHTNRTLVLCFDGTGDQFDADVS